MTFDENFAILALSGFSNSTLRHIIYNTADEALPLLSFVIETPTAMAKSPWTTFLANTVVYSFFRVSGLNDSLHCLHLSDNSTSIITLPTTNASIAISPDRRLALVWTQYSKVYFFDITHNFSLLSTYNGSAVNVPGTTQCIKFSSDSAFAILETGNLNPVRVINLTDFTIAFSVNISKVIISVDFLDVKNRFIFINCPSIAYVYDTVTSTLLAFNASLNATSVLVDQNSSQLIASISGTFFVFGVNGTVNGSLVFGHYYNSSTIPHSSSPPSTSSTSSSSFSYPLNLSTWQNQTFETMRSMS
jgi:hypothetical protein